MNLVGEVYGCGTSGQLDDGPFWSVDKYLVLEDVLPDRFDKFIGPGGLSLPFQQLPEPGHLFFEALVLGLPLFIAPVGRDTIF